MSRISNHNRRAWDNRVLQRLHHTRPASDRLFLDPTSMADIYGWVGRDLSKKFVLCLGAGGGRHGPLYAAAGAHVTVVDVSPKMLELDQTVARQRKLSLQTIETSMEDLTMLAPARFDLVIQPVSTCYVADVTLVYRQVARVTAPGGLYISQHKQPASLQASPTPQRDGYTLTASYYRTGPLPPAPDGSLHRETGCLEFLHRWEDLLGGMCRSGFVIEDLLEPRHADPKAPAGSFGHRSLFLPPYVTVKARRSPHTPAAHIAPSILHP